MTKQLTRPPAQSRQLGSHLIRLLAQVRQLDGGRDRSVCFPVRFGHGLCP